MAHYTKLNLSMNGMTGVASLNALIGALTLVGGTGISITPSGTNITIATTATWANQSLSNLTSPTAVNFGLLPSTTNSIDLGSSSKTWAHGQFGTSVTSPLFTNQASPDANAVLDLNSTTKGILIPRMNTTQRNTLGALPPSTGMIVYDATLETPYWYSATSVAWMPMGVAFPITSAPTTSAAAPQYAFSGNTTGGTFYGTTPDTGGIGNGVGLAASGSNLIFGANSGILLGNSAHAPTISLGNQATGTWPTLTYANGSLTISVADGGSSQLALTSAVTSPGTATSLFMVEEFTTSRGTFLLENCDISWPTGQDGLYHIGAVPSVYNATAGTIPNSKGQPGFVYAKYGMRVGNTTTIDPSAVLQADSTTQGFLPPRTTSASVTTPATGLIIYDTGANKLKVWTGAAWETITSV